MSHALELLNYGGIDAWMTMPMHVAPQAADTIQQSPVVGIDQPHPFGSIYHQRLVFGHLGKGVPIMLAVPIQKFIPLFAQPSSAPIQPHDLPAYQWTCTGAPGRTPSIALALSPTNTIVSGPCSSTVATSVIAGWL